MSDPLSPPLAVRYPGFHQCQLVQSSICIVTQVGFLFVLCRHKSMHTLSFFQLVALSISDLLFSIVLFLFGSVMPIVSGTAVTSSWECGWTAFWYTWALLLSMESYVLIALERYRYLCLVSRERYTIGQLFRYWLVGAALVALLALVPFMQFGLDAAAPMPSGSYCLPNWKKPSVTIVILTYMLTMLVALAFLYGSVARVLYRINRKSVSVLSTANESLNSTAVTPGQALAAASEPLPTNDVRCGDSASINDGSGDDGEGEGDG
eukprot:CAMPEP_0115842610 /NCGR_PEP_ID=MMETSP0287-20121206/7889_1 /TAXON_ID=412157 /ORGANISM="Chrysochromulina rotalis, Strain UIO044" /LENGTH=263 /DNA_ID=CAMNT_0003296285 /DNA_START=11 /DNA_END=798 /DNA_ORIENTATION=+